MMIYCRVLIAEAVGHRRIPLKWNTFHIKKSKLIRLLISRDCLARRFPKNLISPHQLWVIRTSEMTKIFINVINYNRRCSQYSLIPPLCTNSQKIHFDASMWIFLVKIHYYIVHWLSHTYTHTKTYTQNQRSTPDMKKKEKKKTYQPASLFSHLLIFYCRCCYCAYMHKTVIK